MDQDAFRAYVLYATNLPTDQVRLAEYEAEIAKAYSAGDAGALKMVQAVWAVNKERGMATRRLYDAAAALCAQGTVALLSAMRQNVSVVTVAPTVDEEPFTLHVGASTFSVPDQVAAVALHFHLLTWYPQYLRAIARGGESGGSVSVHDEEFNLFVDMCTSLKRVADGADSLRL